MSEAPVNVRGLDHIVLTCTDIERTLSWYCDQLGLAPERVDEWRAGKTFFPSARVDTSTIIDFFPAGDTPPDVQAPNLNHVCLVVEPADFTAIAASGTFDVVDGPAQRWGAR